MGWQPESMPRLDNLFKVFSRLNPSDSSKFPPCKCSTGFYVMLVADTDCSICCKVPASYTFVDGTHCEAGSWAYVPQRSLMRNLEDYPNATFFHVFRFLPSQDTEYIGSASRFTDVGPKFPFWGAGKRVW